jgi:serine phosphatase RsbU (regulator of sigma subunit)
MAAAADLPLAEMASAVLHQEPPLAVPGMSAGPAAAAVTTITGGACADGAELVGVLAEHLRSRFGATAVAAWLLEPDGALEMLGQSGLAVTDASRWRRIPPQFDCAEQRATGGADDPGQPPRAILALRDRAGIMLGILEAWWDEPAAPGDPGTERDPGTEWGPGMSAALADVAAGFAEVLVARLSGGSLGSPLPASAVFGLLDEIAGSVLVARPVRDASGKIADFAILHLSPGYVDPAGRPAAHLAGASLLEAYPASASVTGDGLFARAMRVADSGTAEYVPGEVAAPLTGEPGGDAVAIADLRAAPCYDGVAFTWCEHSASARHASLMRDASRLGQMGAWEENLLTGAAYWTDIAFAVFGLDPALATPIPTALLHSFVIAADQALVRRLRESVVERREPATGVFRIVRPGDAALPGEPVLRQIRIFAEPVLAGPNVVALRGAFQDVSAHYHTQVALAATRDQLADSEQRAAEEHLLALRLQRAIMPPDPEPVRAAGVDVAVRYRPAEAGHLVAGDWYDALLLPGGDLFLVVGDITGHGIDAVTGMIGARNALRGLAATGAGPAELLRHLNYAACHLGEGIAGTVVCGMYDPGTRLLRWARAGHLPPVLVRSDVADTLPLPDGVLLGLDPEAEYEEARLQLWPGDSLLLFTDGLIERRTASISEALGDLVSAAVPAGADASAHADRILASAASDTGDDACLVAVRIL